jgi:DNA-binding NarL/FixJ family response regulator
MAPVSSRGSPDSLKTRRREGVEIAVAASPPLFCEILSRQLDEEPKFVVVGRSATEDHVGKVLAKENPRVLLFDYEGLGPNVEAAVQRLRRTAPKTRILVLSSKSGDDTVERVLRSGASGLFGKQQKFSLLVDAIQRVAAGEIWARPSATARALENLTGPSNGGSKSDLTPRELEVAEACSRGLRNKQIAKQLHISEKTVKGHLNNIFRKLDIDNRFALGLYIREPDPPAVS